MTKTNMETSMLMRVILLGVATVISLARDEAKQS